MWPALLPSGALGRLPHHCCASRRGAAGVVTHARKQAKKARRQREDTDGADTGPRILLDEGPLPQAPSPSSRPPRQGEPDPGAIYPVFAPKPGAEPASAPWRWEDGEDGDPHSDDDPSSSAPSDVPRWNPRTGFMRTAAEVAAEAEAAAAAAAAAAGGGAAAAAAAAGPSGRPPPRAPSAPPEVSLLVPSADPGPPPPPSGDGTYPAPPPLPPASRSAVLTSALGTGFWMAALAVFIRNYAALNSATAMGTDPGLVEVLLRWPSGLETAGEAAIAAGTALLVTGARLALMATWADMREATQRSNAQILTPLGPISILVVALASGIPEELLFRGALIPATYPDWRGALIAAVIFGALHVSGGRNPAFAVWAGAVGGVYGAVFLVTGNVWVPAAAHVAANAASAFVWKASNGAGAQGVGKR